MLLFIVLLNSVLTLIGLIIVIYLLRPNRFRATREAPSTVLISDPHPEPDRSAEALTNDNVMTRLTFEESLDSVQFATASQEAALNDVNRQLAARAADGITVVLNGITLHQSTVTMVVSASQNGKALINEGVATIGKNASGNALPMVRNVKTGQWVEMMQEANTAKAMARLAAISTAIVGAAHIISAADIAKRLKEVDAKINLLLAYRRIDQLAALDKNEINRYGNRFWELTAGYHFSPSRINQLLGYPPAPSTFGRIVRPICFAEPKPVTNASRRWPSV